jgi:carboxymethylenebutenolidase
MTYYDIRTGTVLVPNPPIHIEAYLAQPVLPGPWPAVIVWPEVYGVNDHIRDVTERIAHEGYVAIAPALYQRQAPGFAVGYTDAELELGRTYKNQTTAPELLSDAQATIAYLQALPQVREAAIASLGFCFGGHVAYLVATLPEIKASAVFYGAGIATMTPGGGAPTLTRTPEIKGILYAFFGDQDSLIPREDVSQISQALQASQIDHQIFCYPAATHGFFCDQRASYQPNAAADAWTHVKQLLSTTFGETSSPPLPER